MENITLKCRVITPMFMAGADRRGVELRPSEFKGMMRFWWRAIKAEDNIEDLRKKEAEIFGGTGEREGKSKITIKVYPQPKDNDIGKNLKNDFQLEWRFDGRTNSLIGRDAGIGYLLYSTVLSGKEREYIKPNFQFFIEISSYDENSFKNALASLWASIYLGGFGTRARRGAGNIIVEEVEGDSKELDFIPKGENASKIFEWLKSNLDKCFSIIKCNNNFCTKYTNLSFSRIIISNEIFSDWKLVLNDIGKIYAEFRKNHKREIFDIAAFGLPITHKISGRRASPLLIKIISFKEKFYWIVLRLSGEFLQEGDVLVFKGKTQKPDYKLIDEFWNKLKENNKNKEFVLSCPEVLKKITEKIKKECDPDKIILFGSRARGDAHKNADIDIAVENPKKPISSIDISASLDIVDLKNANSDLTARINREGVIIYERKS